MRNIFRPGSARTCRWSFIHLSLVIHFSSADYSVRSGGFSQALSESATFNTHCIPVIVSRIYQNDTRVSIRRLALVSYVGVRTCRTERCHRHRKHRCYFVSRTTYGPELLGWEIAAPWSAAVPHARIGKNLCSNCGCRKCTQSCPRVCRSVRVVVRLFGTELQDRDRQMCTGFYISIPFSTFQWFDESKDR